MFITPCTHPNTNKKRQKLFLGKLSKKTSHRRMREPLRGSSSDRQEISQQESINEKGF